MVSSPCGKAGAVFILLLATSLACACFNAALSPDEKTLFMTAHDTLMTVPLKQSASQD